MSSDNVAIARRFVEAFNRLDIDSVAGDLDPEVELHEWPTAPGAQVYHGRDGVRQALDTWFEIWEWMRVEVLDVLEAGDRVLVTLHQRAKGKGSAIEVEIKSSNVYTFRNGKVARLELFTEHDAALEAAGISAPGADVSNWNVEVVRRVLDAFDLEGIDEQALTMLDPEVELREFAEAPDTRTFRGHEGIGQALQSWLDAWQYIRMEPVEVAPVGDDRVYAASRALARGKGSGVEIEFPLFQVYTLLEGKVTRIETFTERDNALRAAGLSGDIESEEVR